MNRRIIPMLALGGILVIIGVVGYLIPPVKSAIPNRVLLTNDYGRVVFTHAQHEQYQAGDCIRCHHDLKVTSLPVAIGKAATLTPALTCEGCHDAVDDEKFAQRHQDIYNQLDGGKSCLPCHHEETAADATVGSVLSGKEVGKSFEPCATCHPTMPGTMDAFHQQCYSCHEEVGSGPTSESPCGQCHIF